MAKALILTHIFFGPHGERIEMAESPDSYPHLFWSAWRADRDGRGCETLCHLAWLERPFHKIRL